LDHQGDVKELPVKEIASTLVNKVEELWWEESDQM
jgi:hypothetical protein